MRAPGKMGTRWLREAGGGRLGAGMGGKRGQVRGVQPTHQNDGVSSSEVKKNAKERESGGRSGILEIKFEEMKLNVPWALY